MYDYIIIGAGPAGCVLANRLSEYPGARVLLLDTGLHRPVGLASFAAPPGRQEYATVPQPRLGGRVLRWPQGDVLGGSSLNRAMCHARGLPADYDDWAAGGANGWEWERVLPYFLRGQDDARGGDAGHGDDNPLEVPGMVDPPTRAFIDAAHQLGLPVNHDCNGPLQEGVGLYRASERCPGAAYLAPARARANLTVHTGAVASRITFERGRRANGVTYSMHGKAFHQPAAREVFLCAGPITSPQLLMLSGIGPADALRRLAIPLVHEAPAVGGNLQDQLHIRVLQQCSQPLRHDRASGLKAALHGLLRGRRGIGTTAPLHAGGFVRSPLAADGRPDIQLHFIPAMADGNGLRRECHVLQAGFLRPRSRGRLSLVSNRASDAPRIDPDYLGDPDRHDLRAMLECARLSLGLLAQRAFDPYRGAALFPAPMPATEAECVAFVRDHAQSACQPAGTCRMGSDASAVVDPQLRVHGVDGLRVVDASVMPTLPGGNTHAPTVMIAERAADLVRGQA